VSAKMITIFKHPTIIRACSLPAIRNYSQKNDQNSIQEENGK
jgi:hypothetical protein